MTPTKTPRTGRTPLLGEISRGNTPLPVGVRAPSWGEVEAAARVLAVKVRGLSGEKGPDYVLAVAAGGLVPAAVLKHRLGVHSVGAVQFEHYAGEGTRRKGGARMLGLLPSPIRNHYPKHVLVVDDVAETGDTLRALEGELDRLVPRVTWAALFLKRDTTSGLPEPFIFAERADPETWLRFPWESGP